MVFRRRARWIALHDELDARPDASDKTRRRERTERDACGPESALIVHVGECRQRNHTGKDDVARERAGQGDGPSGKEIQTTPDSSQLSRNRKLDRGCRHLRRSRETSVRVDSRNRRQSSPTTLPFLLLFLFLLPFRVASYRFSVDITHSCCSGETPYSAEKERKERGRERKKKKGREDPIFYSKQF